MNMNERGFFTIIGLFLLVIVAISIKGVQEFETNHSRSVANFQAEHKLQNLAESFLAEESEKILAINAGETYSNYKKIGNYNGLENCMVEIRAQNLYMKKYIRTYSSGSNYTDNSAGENPYNVKIIICVASCDSSFIVGKIYRRALAYILDDDPATENFDESATVHYLNNL